MKLPPPTLSDVGSGRDRRTSLVMDAFRRPFVNAQRSLELLNTLQCARLLTGAASICGHMPVRWSCRFS
ncbi:hypothetical protein PBY51_009402 [Eleginops maclovinus]|uniref:Uncharacterized protein n=1 Tax=Eleginops maclovinus TaxID=56733 RepID=A0AAN8AUX8_ELEMC|nr:hypothetical protein PBY51_009402 [Eleginops maclovinus]